MKQIIITLVISITLWGLSASTIKEDSITGIWKAPDLGNSTIEVYRAKDNYIYGKILDSDESSWVGKIILRKVQYNAGEKVWEGEVYSLKRYMSIDVVISLESSTKLKLVGTKFFMTKTFYWNK